MTLKFKVSVSLVGLKVKVIDIREKKEGLNIRYDGSL